MFLRLRGLTLDHVALRHLHRLQPPRNLLLSVIVSIFQLPSGLFRLSPTPFRSFMARHSASPHRAPASVHPPLQIPSLCIHQASLLISATKTGVRLRRPGPFFLTWFSAHLHPHDLLDIPPILHRSSFSKFITRPCRTLPPPPQPTTVGVTSSQAHGRLVNSRSLFCTCTPSAQPIPSQSDIQLQFLNHIMTKRLATPPTVVPFIDELHHNMQTISTSSSPSHTT